MRLFIFYEADVAVPAAAAVPKDEGTAAAAGTATPAEWGRGCGGGRSREAE